MPFIGAFKLNPHPWQSKKGAWIMTESTVVSMQCFPHALPLIQTHRSTHRRIGISVLIAWKQARLLWKEDNSNRHRSNHYSTFDMGARHPQFDEFFMSQPPPWDG
jgi:hypothetical protein